MGHLGGMRTLATGDVVPGTRYRVVRQVGRGGMGCVYEVEQIELGRRFVLKALLPEHAAREDLEARIRQEWRTLGRLRHPGIVEVTDAGVTDDGAPYFVMELLTGETLRAKLRRERRLEAGEAIAIAVEVLEALAAAHDLGVVHRDVKPANVFLVGPRRIKLLDFGIAKVAVGGQTVTARGVTLGTPRYLSPEQVRGDPVDGRADLYAVGLLLFEMLTGRGPFDEDRDPNALLLAHLTREAPRLDAFLPGADPRLVDLVTRLLAKQPSARPAAARTAASALRRLESEWPLEGDRSLEAAALVPPALAAPAGGSVRGATCATEVIPLPGASPRGGRWLVTERIPTGCPGDGAAASTARRPAELAEPTFIPAPVAESSTSGVWLRLAQGGAADEGTLRLGGEATPVADPTRTARSRLEPASSNAAWTLAPTLSHRASLLAAALAFLVTCFGVAALVLGWWIDAREGAGARPGSPPTSAARTPAAE